MAKEDPCSQSQIIGTLLIVVVVAFLSLVVYWFFCRESRFVFQWSGLKRVEAISGQPWESSPKSCIVLIGTDKSELQTIISQLSASADPHNKVSSEYGNLREHAKSFASMVASDDRFKVLIFFLLQLVSLETAYVPYSLTCSSCYA